MVLYVGLSLYKMAIIGVSLRPGAQIEVSPEELAGRTSENFFTLFTKAADAVRGAG